jgi:hypothetical protein
MTIRLGDECQAEMVFARRYIVLLSLLALSQTVAVAQKRSTPADETLAAPFDDGSFSPAMYVDIGAKTAFHLETSWIPGKEHKGMFRYKIFVSPSESAVDRATNQDFYSPSAITAQMKRIQNCSENLVLYDSGGFELREIGLMFGLGVDRQGVVTALYANSAEQMDASEYRQFLRDGSWTITWSCPGM